ncbi:DUF1345 domain-containing protein [Ramlibacter sp. MMS24-I3-19]|uniref:DUF1345 domain-containing protein n=1 Tax=Ramlibacter sp. MMS24-I3-19 TaxID=3416606 RepID=UPI003D039A54
MTADTRQQTRDARRHARLWPALRARPRLLASLLLGIAAYAAGAVALHMQGAVVALLAWNAASMLYLGLAWQSMRRVPIDVIQSRSVLQDEGRMTILLLVVVAAAAVLLAVGTQLANVRNLPASARGLHLVLALTTIVTSWLFTQVLFAQHYAHDFYIARHRHEAEPLDFPGTPDPDYGDFLYFSCIIGTSAQTADVSFTSSALRRIGTLHCVLSFFFNATLLALSINVAAGLLQ